MILIVSYGKLLMTAKLLSSLNENKNVFPNPDLKINALFFGSSLEHHEMSVYPPNIH